jgi:hypothetical protein
MSALLPTVLAGLPLEKMGYLELGVLAGQCFNRVPAGRKVGVDVRPRIKDPRVWVGTTDAYFVQAKEKFDIILVDACHEYGQVKRDLAGCSKVLNLGGLVFCHDMVPPTQRHISPDYCWNTYRVLGWCLQNDVPCWVTTEDFGLVAFTDPGRAAQAPSHYTLSFNALHDLLKRSPHCVLKTEAFKRVIHEHFSSTSS